MGRGDRRRFCQFSVVLQSRLVLRVWSRVCGADGSDEVLVGAWLQLYLVKVGWIWSEILFRLIQFYFYLVKEDFSFCCYFLSWDFCYGYTGQLIFLILIFCSGFFGSSFWFGFRLCSQFVVRCVFEVCSDQGFEGCCVCRCFGVEEVIGVSILGFFLGGSYVQSGLGKLGVEWELWEGGNQLFLGRVLEIFVRQVSYRGYLGFKESRRELVGSGFRSWSFLLLRESLMVRFVNLNFCY